MFAQLKPMFFPDVGGSQSRCKNSRKWLSERWCKSVTFEFRVLLRGKLKLILKMNLKCMQMVYFWTWTKKTNFSIRISILMHEKLCINA